MPILHCTPFKIDFPSLMTKLRMRQDSSHANMLRELILQAEEVAKPKGLYDLAFIEARGDDWVMINDIQFNSRILCVNLNGVQRIFPYVVTCGIELEQWSVSLDDFLIRFWADAIKEYALHYASETLKNHIIERFNPGLLSSMNPGSLGDFPLSAQKYLFALLGDVQTKIGVQLTSSYLMLPTKSVSGILFPSEHHFSSCQLCPREKCSSRRAPYDASLYDARFAYSGKTSIKS